MLLLSPFLSAFMHCQAAGMVGCSGLLRFREVGLEDCIVQRTATLQLRITFARRTLPRLSLSSCLSTVFSVSLFS